MDTKTLIPVVLALIIGGVGGYVLAGQAPVDHSAMTMDQMMTAMNAELAGKEGDAFDQAFLTEMIAHHMGAVEMAETALQNAGREEIKQMAQAIIAAQNAEIAQMQAWYSEWYANSPAAIEEAHHAE